jgi:ribosomal protein L18E
MQKNAEERRELKVRSKGETKMLNQTRETRTDDRTIADESDHGDTERLEAKAYRSYASAATVDSGAKKSTAVKRSGAETKKVTTAAKEKGKTVKTAAVTTSVATKKTAAKKAAPAKESAADIKKATTAAKEKGARAARKTAKRSADDELEEQVGEITQTTDDTAALTAETEAKAAVKSEVKAKPEKAEKADKADKAEKTAAPAKKAAAPAEKATEKKPAAKAVAAKKEVKPKAEAKAKAKAEAEATATEPVAKAPKRMRLRKCFGRKTIVNLDDISAKFKEGEVVNLETMKERGLIGENVVYVKVLARGYLKKALTVEAQKFSEAAANEIVRMGGVVRSV